MISITVQCEDWDEVRMLSNATQLHHLMTDYMEAMRSARKHGTDEDQLKVFDRFESDIYRALENHLGAY
jgi:hypothetical protein